MSLSTSEAAGICLHGLMSALFMVFLNAPAAVLEDLAELWDEHRTVYMERWVAFNSKNAQKCEKLVQWAAIVFACGLNYGDVLALTTNQREYCSARTGRARREWTF